MVDVFVLLQLPNAGDDLQAIKKGIVEIADLIVFNKADIDERAAAFARGQMRAALTMLRSASPNWRPPVLTVSALPSAASPSSGPKSNVTGAPWRQRRIRRKAPPAGRGLDVESDRFRSAPLFPGASGGALGTAGTVTRRRRRAHDARRGSLTTADLSEALIA
jgi:hypothetical protein